MERLSIFETKMDKVLDWSKYLLSITPVNGEVKEISSRKNLELIFFNHPLKSKQLKPKKFYVAEHPIYKNKCFVAAGENYELFPFSVNSALKKTTNLREYLHSACRWIVKDQVNYKKNQIIQKIGLMCQKTGKYLARKNLHLHHEAPYEFNIICDSFLKAKNIKLHESIFKYDRKGVLLFKDQSLIYEFLKYHARFLNDGHVSLVSGKINQKLGTSFKFKNVVPAIATATASEINGRSFSQLNLFLQEEA